VPGLRAEFRQCAFSDQAAVRDNADTFGHAFGNFQNMRRHDDGGAARNALAQNLHISGPVAMAVAGLLIGNRGVTYAMSDTTRDHVIKFWGLVDEVLNAVLFLLIGLEGVALIGNVQFLIVGLFAIPLVLIARVMAVGAPLAFWRKSLPFKSTMPVMVWGGLRGGISIALALSLPAGEIKDLLVTSTYVVVLFSVLVQGSTIGSVIRAKGADRT